MNDTIYLLTGAAGFLGSNISRQLIMQGKNVRALVLRGDPAEKHIPSDVEIVTGDLLDIGSLDRFFDVGGYKDLIVIHCASFVTVSPDFNQKVYDVNVNGTKNIIDKCIEYKAKKLVYISSTSAIPELADDQLICEVDHFDPDRVIGFYGKTKAEATQLVLDAVKNNDLDASIVFPSGICGPNDFAYGPVAKFLIDYCHGEMKAGIPGSFNAVDVRDLADGVISCTENGQKGEGYIMSNSIVSIKEMLHLASSYTGEPEVKVILPLPITKMIAFFMSIGSKLTGKPSYLTSFSIYNLTRNNNFSSEKAMRELGFHTRPFKETIADSVAWLVTEGKVELARPVKRTDIQRAH